MSFFSSWRIWWKERKNNFTIFFYHEPNLPQKYFLNNTYNHATCIISTAQYIWHFNLFATSM
jgi:hypothetical protein